MTQPMNFTQTDTYLKRGLKALLKNLVTKSVTQKKGEKESVVKTLLWQLSFSQIISFW